jgi:aerobic carbon-monoxide dehydrogenase medium subunit
MIDAIVTYSIRELAMAKGHHRKITSIQVIFDDVGRRCRREVLFLKDNLHTSDNYVSQFPATVEGASLECGENRRVRRCRWRSASVAVECAMKFPSFAYVRPTSVKDAVRHLVDGDGEARIIAGGQSLLPMMAFRLLRPAVLVDIGDIEELKTIAVDGDAISIGALVRWCEIERSALLSELLPLLPAAMAHVAHYQIRNRGTIGGSLAHCDPAAEMPALAIVCDAEIVISGPAGDRVAPAREVLCEALAPAIEPDEMIVAVRFARWSTARKWGFSEISRRKGDFAMAGIALHYEQGSDARMIDVHVGVFGAAQVPQRLPKIEGLLEGRRPTEDLIAGASAAVAEGIDPPEDIHATAEYRRALAAVVFERALRHSIAACGAGVN